MAGLWSSDWNQVKQDTGCLLQYLLPYCNICNKYHCHTVISPFLLHTLYTTRPHRHHMGIHLSNAPVILFFHGKYIIPAFLVLFRKQYVSRFLFSLLSPLCLPVGMGIYATNMVLSCHNVCFHPDFTVTRVRFPSIHPYFSLFYKSEFFPIPHC